MNRRGFLTRIAGAVAAIKFAPKLETGVDFGKSRLVSLHGHEVVVPHRLVYPDGASFMFSGYIANINPGGCSWCGGFDREADRSRRLSCGAPWL